MYASALYKVSPSWIQELMIAARSLGRAALRERGTFARLRDEALETQWYTPDELRAYQLEHLKKLLWHAQESVPYYRALFAKAGFHAEALQAPEHIEALPFLTKETVRKHDDDLVWDTPGKPLFRCHTSGATGTPLRMIQDLHAVRRENAFVWRQLKWAGFREGERRAWIRGDMVVPIGRTSGPYWRLDRGENALMLSSYHLSQANARLYIEALGSFDPHIIQAYPSSIAFLASHLEAQERQFRGTRLKAIVTSSETLSEAQRDTVQRAFGCRIFDWYGNGERTAAIGTCEEGRSHVMSDYSYFEPIPLGDGTHEIVGTNFNNYVMPFIRYRTGDRVRLAAKTERCTCGRWFPLVEEIHGRKDDVVKLPDGRHVGRLHQVFLNVPNLLSGQIVQNTIDEIEIRVVPSERFDQKSKDVLLRNARERLGNEVRIRLITTNTSLRTGNGKLRGVICNV